MDYPSNTIDPQLLDLSGNSFSFGLNPTSSSYYPTFDDEGINTGATFPSEDSTTCSRGLTELETGKDIPCFCSTCFAKDSILQDLIVGAESGNFPMRNLPYSENFGHGYPVQPSSTNTSTVMAISSPQPMMPQTPAPVTQGPGPPRFSKRRKVRGLSAISNFQTMKSLLKDALSCDPTYSSDEFKLKMDQIKQLLDKEEDLTSTSVTRLVSHQARDGLKFSTGSSSMRHTLAPEANLSISQGTLNDPLTKEATILRSSIPASVSNDIRSASSINNGRQSRPSAYLDAMYQCTFPDCDRTFSEHYEWKRHEESLHWNRVRYMCLECDDGITDSQGVAKCTFCSTPCTNAEAVKLHNLHCSDARVALTTFARKDKLLQHLKKDHRMQGMGEVALEWAYEVDSNWPRECGFCGSSLNDWDLRATHLEYHFVGGSKKSEWRIPFRREKNTTPHQFHNPHGGDDDDDNTDASRDRDDFFSGGNGAWLSGTMLGQSNAGDGPAGPYIGQSTSPNYTFNGFQQFALLSRIPDPIAASAPPIHTSFTSALGVAVSVGATSCTPILSQVKGILSRNAFSMELPVSLQRYMLEIEWIDRLLLGVPIHAQPVQSVSGETQHFDQRPSARPKPTFTRSRVRSSISGQSSLSSCSTISDATTSITRVSSVASARRRIQLPSMNQRLAMNELSYCYDLPCEFAFLGCEVQFRPEEFESWVHHSLWHFANCPPPAYAICNFCDDDNARFDNSQDAYSNWWDRMIHVAAHLFEGSSYSQSRPDFWVVEYLFKNNLMSVEDYRAAIEYTERPHCDGLLPLGLRIKRPVKDRQSKQESRVKEGREMRKNEKQKGGHDGKSPQVILEGDFIEIITRTAVELCPSAVTRSPNTAKAMVGSKVTRDKSKAEDHQNLPNLRSSSKSSGLSSSAHFLSDISSLGRPHTGSSRSTISSRSRSPKTKGDALPEAQLRVLESLQITQSKTKEKISCDSLSRQQTEEILTIEVQKAPADNQGTTLPNPSSHNLATTPSKPPIKSGRYSSKKPIITQNSPDIFSEHDNVLPNILENTHSSRSTLGYYGGSMVGSRSSDMKYRVPDTDRKYLSSSIRSSSKYGQIEVVNHFKAKYNPDEPRSSHAKLSEIISAKRRGNRANR